MELDIPEMALVMMVGPTSSGKSAFAARHFLPTEIVSSDACRAMICDDENDQEATDDAFAVLHAIVDKRLARGKFTVVDATNLERRARQPLLRLAREHCVPAVALVLNLPLDECLARHRRRDDRSFGEGVVRDHHRQLQDALRDLERKRFRHVFILSTSGEVDGATVNRVPLPCDRRWDRGPFDIIGDIHGCFDELCDLLEKLGYRLDRGEAGSPGANGLRVIPPLGRKVLFLGDLVDRGPKVVEVLRLVMAMAAEGAALCLPGNHEAKLLRKIRGHQVKMRHGLEASWRQLSQEDEAFHGRVDAFFERMVSHFVLDDGRLVAAHAGMKAAMQGRDSARVDSFALYGETTGEIDEFGLPERVDWARDYRGSAMVVYGHTPVTRAAFVNNTICIDTGCVYGGRLTALRYPERELVSVPARAIHCQLAGFPLAAVRGGAMPDAE